MDAEDVADSIQACVPAAGAAGAQLYRPLESGKEAVLGLCGGRKKSRIKSWGHRPSFHLSQLPAVRAVSRGSGFLKSDVKIRGKRKM